MVGGLERELSSIRSNSLRRKTNNYRSFYWLNPRVYTRTGVSSMLIEGADEKSATGKMCARETVSLGPPANKIE